MTATSPPMRSVAAAALVLTPTPTLNRLSFPFAHRHCPSTAAPRWRPARCRGKPAVEDVVHDDEEETWRREANPERKDGGEEMLGRGWFMVDEIGMEILTIALPAVLALAADPITALIDTAFVGHVGSTELAAVGVSISIFNLVSKLLNVPLLNVTTSFVAEQQAVDADYNSSVENSHIGEEISISQEKAGEQRKFLPAVSTSLALAAGIGLMETVALILGSGTLLDIVGVPVDSPMRIPAEQFLTLRAYGAPPVIVALAAQGAFRGFMDTKTPLFAVVAGNLVNALLDAIFIFPLGLGVSGAALATVTSEYLTAFILLWKLNSKIVLFSWNIVSGDIIRYLKSGALLIARTIAVVLTFTVSTSLAAREGSVPMAGYEICLQVWLTISLLNDALALAGQALLASEYAKGNYKKARIIGGVTGAALSTTLLLGFGYLSMLFTDDAAVLDVAQTGVWFVTVSQPINAVAFVMDGLYYGVSDFAFVAYSTVQISILIMSHCILFAGAISSTVLLVAAPKFGLGGVWAGLTLFMSLRAIAGFWREQRWTMENNLLFAGAVSSAVLLAVAPNKLGLGGVWAGLTLFMSLQAIAGFWRLRSKDGPWKIIWSVTE
uniref:Protein DETOXIFICATION n=1 Tax=Oryza nivara TaxID=4536 RepID=A0A0E0J5V6_ORYNI